MLLDVEFNSWRKQATWNFFSAEIGRTSGNNRRFCDVSWVKKAGKAGDPGSEPSIKAEISRG